MPADTTAPLRPVSVIKRDLPHVSHGGTVAFVDGGFGQAVLMRRRHSRLPAPRSSFAGFRFPPEVITVAVRWYLRYAQSYRDVEELLAVGFQKSAMGRELWIHAARS